MDPQLQQVLDTPTHNIIRHEWIPNEGPFSENRQGRTKICCNGSERWAVQATRASYSTDNSQTLKNYKESHDWD
ncbi:uncharacterized protein N7529_011817 [Penicillium soppii]|jgi:hypothetical protein|uniref:uncharacterized protein n=1 Tax=Penicillium soppii TaxID=69789 RepID=UPI00254964FB|nr:uncharacterized protein N7529_011817 [Penicillium soppii]KAJ5852432.1 hypothetical protein N7529_011817 [Penicillium soppii]